MGISGGEYKQLVQALIKAFPTREALAAMMQFQLDQSLNEVSGNANLSVTAFELVQWAVAQNRVQDLVRGAIVENPGNPYLQLINIAIKQAEPPQHGDLASLVPLLRWADANGRLGQLISLACAPGAPEPDLRAFINETLASATDRAKIATPTSSTQESVLESIQTAPTAAETLRELARRYDAVRAAMPFSDARTQALEEVASQMRAAAPARCRW